MSSSRLRRFRGGAFAAAAALLALSPAATSTSFAAVGPIPSGYVTNGTVNTTTTDASGRVYIGGDFDNIGPRLTGATFADTTAGEPVAGFPQVTGTVNAVESDGAGGWFIGGAFSAVGDVKRANLAHVLADGTVDADWNPAASSTVNALTRSGSTLYVGGNFGTVGGKPRSRLARISTTGAGAADPAWYPEASNTVYALVLRGTTLYVGGSLGDISGAPCVNVCRLSTTSGPTGGVDAGWQLAAPANQVRSLEITDTAVYIGGTFFNAGGALRIGVAKLSLTDASVDPAWDADIDGAGPVEIDALKVIGTKLYIGGWFDGIGGSTAYRHLARVSATGSGAVDATWTPDNLSGKVRSLSPVGDQLYVGGEFTDIGFDRRGGAARLSIASGADAVVSTWNANLNGPANVVAVAGSRVLLAGSFTSGGSNNRLRYGLARFDAAGRLDTAWVPQPQVGGIAALATSADSLYAGGLGVISRVSLSGVGARDTNWFVSTAQPVASLAVGNGAVYAGLGLSNGTDIAAFDSLRKYSATGTGTEDTGWGPMVFGAVNALSLSGTTLYAAGTFPEDPGVVPGHAMKLSATGAGAVDFSWAPNVDGPVLAFTRVGDTFYLGGLFGKVGNVARPRAARVSATGAGALDSAWNPSINNTVRAVAVSGNDVYLGGTFTVVNGETVTRIARVSASNAALDSKFDPVVTGPNVTNLLATGTRVFAGGQIGAITERTVGGFAAFDLAAPTIAITSPAEGAQFTQGDQVTVAFTCTDEGGVIGSCTGTQAAGASLDTGTVGTRSFTVKATDESGNPAERTVSYTVVAPPPSPPAPPAPPAGGETPAPPRDTTAPLISKAALAPGSFRAAKTGGSTAAAKGKKPKSGGRLTLTLSEGGTLKGTVVRPKKGKKKAKTLGSFTLPVRTGANVFDFLGRVAGKKLAAGSYTLELSVTDAAGNLSAAKTVKFTVKR